MYHLKEIHPKAYLAEVLGTFGLVFLACGPAILGAVNLGLEGSAVMAGLTVYVLIHIFGPLSGGHFNPAISFAFFLNKSLSAKDFLCYFASQVVGGILAAAVLFFIATHKSGFDVHTHFASNGYNLHSPAGYHMHAAFIIEAVAMLLFSLGALATTAKTFPKDHAPLFVGMALVVTIILVAPVTGASLNPARSIATAVFQQGWALEQLWLFIVAPLTGAFCGSMLWKMIRQ